MMATKIEWCDETWNPTVGCKKIAAGCKNCYAERMACRLAAMGQVNYLNVTDHDCWTGQVLCLPERMDIPLKWKKPRRVFVDSMSDLFHEDVPVDFVRSVYKVMWAYDWHTYIILTKRPERMFNMLSDKFFTNNPYGHNIHLGVSISNQTDADNFIPWLLRTPAAVRIVSAEPLLSAIDLAPAFCGYNPPSWGYAPNIHHVIVGCESVPNRRPMNIDWVRSLRDQCVEAGVPFFLKQLEIDGKLVKMPALDGQVWDQMP